MRTCRRTSSSADACCLSVFFAMAGTVNVEAAELCHCPPLVRAGCPPASILPKLNADRALSPERDELGVAAASQAARYDVNDKPSVRRTIEPFHCQRDE